MSVVSVVGVKLVVGGEIDVGVGGVYRKWVSGKHGRWWM